MVSAKSKIANTHGVRQFVIRNFKIHVGSANS